jgi:hypothetical protein
MANTVEIIIIANEIPREFIAMSIILEICG